MKKKKIINVRKSLITSALALTTVLGGLGILKSCNNDIQNQDPTKSENLSSSSSTIIDNNNGNGQEDLPGGVVIDPITEDPNIDPIDPSKDPVINEGPTETPGNTTTTPSVPNINNQGSSSTGTETEKPDVTNPSVTEPGTETPEHTHTLGEWVSIDDEKEGNYCLEDGTLVLTRTHDYKITDIKAIDTLDGYSHDTIVTETCTTCGHEKSTTYSREGHNYGEKTWDETYEYETCNECGYTRTLKHDLDKGIIKGNKIIYTCENEGCGFTDTKVYNPGHSHSGGSNTPTNPTKPEHTHTLGEWVSIDNDKEGSYCPEDGVLVDTREHNYTVTNSTTDENGKTIDTYTCGYCGNSYTQERGSQTVDPENPNKPDQPSDPINIDTSGVVIDSKLLSSTYNGETPIVDLSSVDLPDNVTIKKILLVTDDGEVDFEAINAGTYNLKITFDTPKGYTADPIYVDYTINKAQVSLSYNYDKDKGKLNAVYKGIAENDIEKINYIVNNNEVEADSDDNSINLEDQYGLYKVQSNIEINPDKIDNYIFPEDLNETAMYEVKRETPWYNIDTKYHEEDGKIILELYLSASNLPCIEYCESPTFGFNVYVDERLAYDYENGCKSEDGWLLTVNPMFINPDENTTTYDGTINDDWKNTEYWEDMAVLPERVKVGQLTFIKQSDLEDDKDIIIRIDKVQGTPGLWDYDFEYTTDGSVCVINPTNPNKPVETITISNNLIDDAILQQTDLDDDEEKEYWDALQEYINDTFDLSTTEDEEETIAVEAQAFNEYQNAEINLESVIDINDDTIVDETNTSLDQIIEETDRTIEEALTEADAKLDAILLESTDDVSTDAALDRIIEVLDRATQEANIKADAELASLIASDLQEDTPMVRARIK